MHYMSGSFVCRLLTGVQILFFIFSAFFCSAVSAFRWPVLLDVDVNLTGAGTAIYSGQWGVVDVDDAYDDYGEKYIGVIHRHISTSGSLVTGSMSNALSVTAKDCPDSVLKLSCMGEKWIEKYGESGSYSVNHSGAENGNECVAIAAVGQQTNASWNDRKYPMVGAAQCIGTPPVEQWCALDTPAIEFAYGSLTLKNAEGKKISHQVDVECTDSIQFILRLRGMDTIQLDNGMYAELTTDNDTPLGTTLEGDVNKTIMLTSELKGAANRTGPFYGSGILFVTYP